MTGPRSSTTWTRWRPTDAMLRGLLALAVCALLLPAVHSQAQDEPAAGSDASAPAAAAEAPRALSATLPDRELSGILEQRGNLTLRDVTIVEALFVLREQWKVDMVVADEITGQVNATFSSASLREILDSLLLSRGYGYQVVGRSIVILPLDQLSALKPLFNPEIVPLQHADPNELIDVVDLLLSPQGKALPLASSRSIMVLDYPDRMQLIRTRLQELDQSAARLAQSTTPGGTTDQPAVPDTFASGTPDGFVQLDVRVFRPQFVKVQTLLPALESLISRNGRVAVLEKEDQVIVAEQTPILDVIEEAVNALDQPRPQVRIWAMIYDCSLDDVERLGVNWRSAGFGNGRRTDGSPRNQALLDAITAAAPAVGVPNGALSLMSLGTNVDITAVINALKQSNESKLLADPNVVVTNHEPAKISIVTEVPYQQLTQGLQGGSIGTTAFREAGVSLEVTPHIARDETISMLVNPQFSVLTGFTENDNQPIIDRREARTTVRVRNGETFVLGGLRQRTRINNRSGIPYLKDVKYVGRLFRYEQESFRDSELLVFITPEIVSVTSELRPREQAADTFGAEELNRNQRAPDVTWSQTEWDSQSFGGPWRTLQMRSDFGFTPTAELSVSESDGSADAVPAAEGNAAQSARVPALPYEDSPSPAASSMTDASTAAGRRPMSQRLQGSIQTVDQGSGPASAGTSSGAALPGAGLPGTGLPGGNGLPGAGPGLNLDALLNILPMSGQKAATPRSTPTRVESSHIQQLSYEAPQSADTPTQRREPRRLPPIPEASPARPLNSPITVDGPSSPVRR